MSKENFFLAFWAILSFMGCSHDNGQIKSDKYSILESQMGQELHEVIMKIWEDAEECNIPELQSAHLKSSKFTKFGLRIAERQNLENTNKSEADHFRVIEDVNQEIENLRIDIFDNMGIATFYNNYSFIKNNARVKGKARVTLIFLRTIEGWKIIHEHSSPFNN